MLAACLMLAANARAGEPTVAEKETARRLMDRGYDRLEDADLEGALEAFRGADDIMRVPTTSLALGEVQLKLGMLLEAVNALRRAARYPVRDDEPEAFATARSRARELDFQIAKRIPAIRVIVKGGPADDVKVDGVAIADESVGMPFRVNPGQHVITAERAGYETATATISVEEPHTERVVLELVPSPHAERPEPAEVDPTPAGASEEALPAWLLPAVGFGVSGAGLIVGAITGGLSLSQTNELEKACGPRPCSESHRDDYDEVIALANASNVGFAIAGAGAAVGVVGLVLWLVGDDEEAGDETARLELGPGGVGLQLRF
jgi:hypothetical protein